MEKIDVMFWDNVGSPYSRSLVDKKAIGGSEYAIVQLAEALAAKSLTVYAYGNGSPHPGAESVYENGVTFANGHRLHQTGPQSCGALVLSRHSTLPEGIEFDRLFVLVQDFHFDGYGVRGADYAQATFVCVAVPQANAFKTRFPGREVVVIQPAIDDAHWAVRNRLLAGEIKKDPNKFVYASAAVKGLDATLTMWRKLKCENYKELELAELHITSPGYDHPRFEDAKFDYLSHHIYIHPPVPPRELGSWMADAAGLFFVNTYPETYCAVAAIAEVVGCRIHVLTTEQGRLDTFLNGTVNSELPTSNPTVFEESFLDSYRRGLPGEGAVWAPKDTRMSATIARWIDLLKPKELTELGPWMPPVEQHTSADPGDKQVYALGVSGSDMIETGIIEKDGTRTVIDQSSVRKPYRAPLLARLARQPLGPTGDYPLLDNRGHRIVSSFPKSVRLVMIAKNEKEVFPRSLGSAKGLVDDALVVLDQEDKEGVPRGLLDGLFVTTDPNPYSGHANARNEAINLAEKIGPDRRQTDYMLMLDADDMLDGTLDKTKLTADIYELDIIDGGLVYGRLSLFKPGTLTFRRRAHEFPESKEGATIEKLTTLRIIRGHGGAARKVPLRKFLRDAEMLEKDYDELHDSRSAFYLAQSFLDAWRCSAPGKLQDDRRRAALEWYRERTRLGGWTEEVFVAWMRIGDLETDPNARLLAYLQAIETVPTRSIEAVTGALSFLNPERRFRAAAALIDGAARWLSDSIPSGLFVDTEAYRYKFAMERIVTEWNLGRKLEARVLTERLLRRADLPDWAREQMNNSLKKDY